eukprot:CCRYP_020169-RA/>CCRYP_020169-RA protein AED:0.57 eAED:0.24 QI:0/0/0/1/1/1/2/0/154
MASKPHQKEQADRKAGMCCDGRETCQDCKSRRMFTKPSKCPTWEGIDEKSMQICQEFHKEWFCVREDLEKTNIKNPDGKHKPEIFRGYCKGDMRGDTSQLLKLDRYVEVCVSLADIESQASSVHVASFISVERVSLKNSSLLLLHILLPKDFAS